MAPTFHQAAIDPKPHARLVKVDTEAEQQLAARFNIRSIPTLAVFRGREIARQSGALDLGSLETLAAGHLYQALTFSPGALTMCQNTLSGGPHEKSPAPTFNWPPHARQPAASRGIGAAVDVGRRAPRVKAEPCRPRHRCGPTSAAGRRRRKPTMHTARPAQNEATDNDPRLRLIRSLVEMLTGRRIEVFNARNAGRWRRTAGLICQPSVGRSPGAARPAGWGMERPPRVPPRSRKPLFDQRHGHHGRWPQIGFSCNCRCRGLHYEESRQPAARRCRPQDRPAGPEFCRHRRPIDRQRFAFDLNADGQAEQINFVAPGSGFLVFDRNQDGKVNNGSELFGPTTDNGFQGTGRPRR